MSDATDVTRLREIQQELAAAWVARDREALERLIAPDWAVIHVEGQRLTRSEVFLMMLVPNVNNMEPPTVDDIEVRVFADAAVVTGRTHARSSRSGERYDMRLRFTDVFVRRDGGWQAVASHATLIGS